jgi:Ca-activated chloride channel homolog
MMRLAWPWMLALLPLPWLLYRLRAAAEAGGAALFLPFAAAVDAPITGRATTIGRGIWWFGAIWLLLVVAAARPQWLGAPVPVAPPSRAVMLAVDVSGSMATPDMGGGATRLQAVKQVAGHFIDGRQGDRIGLILFGTQPYLQAPLSSDLATVHHFLDESVVGVAGPQTAIGDAIGLAIKRLRDDRGLGAGGEVGDSGPGANDPTGPDGAPDARAGAIAQRAILVLLTDGGNDAGVMSPTQAAQLAAQVGLRIYTIGVGAPVEPGLFGLSSGNTDLDETTLKSIARITGGRYFRATDADALRSVYREIDKLEPSTGRAQWLRPATEWFTVPLALALLLSVPAAWTLARRWS